MRKPRLMMIGLDGFELSLAERLLAEGRLPTLRRLCERAAIVQLDHGAAKRTGLAWERFGDYPAQKWIYGFVWPSAEQTREMGDALVRAVDVRADIAEWLFAERLPNWDLGYLVISEYHSAAEALWHGVDPNHPLAGLPSAHPARVGLERVYEAADRMLGRLMDRVPEARFVMFNLHGMGPNDSDVASMALLPELLYRYSFGKPFRRERIWATNASGTPLITSGKGWSSEIIGSMPTPLPQKVRSRLRHLLNGTTPSFSGEALSLHWMPAERYRPFWPRMDALPLHSLYDARIRSQSPGRQPSG